MYMPSPPKRYEAPVKPNSAFKLRRLEVPTSDDLTLPFLDLIYCVVATQIFCIFTPNLGEDEPILTLAWVGKNRQPV